MNFISRKERIKIVQEELVKLKDGNYITKETYQTVVHAQQMYDEDLLEKEIEMSESLPSESLQLAEKQKPKSLKPKKVKIKKTLTPEQIRERNINWLLNLGVVLLLISGLYVATSNWGNMSAWMKTGSIATVSLLFYGIGIFSSKILKIDKTAFAFIVLGSLFLPIFLLSIGWFQLFGSYFSIYGGGRYLFGMLSSFVILPIYISLSRKLPSRLFVWFSYLTLTIGIGFLLASFHFGVDSFYLGIMLFNTLLVVIYHKVKRRESLRLFTSEFAYFAQINLILSTLLMLFFYDSHVLFGFNLMLTAIIYLAMVYVSGKKEFHFVFSAMFVYGVYQLVEFSVLEAISPIVYASIGFIFLFIPKALDEQYAWKRIFDLTSSVITVAAFLFITVEGIVLKWSDPSFILLLAYFVIAVNFLYLSNATKKRLFIYLTPLFVSVALFEAAMLLDETFQFESMILLLFMIGFTVFIIFGTLIQTSFFKIINQSSREVGAVYMLLFSFVALTMAAWWEFGLMLLLVAVCCSLLLKEESRKFLIAFAEWLIPISIGLAVVAFGEEIRVHSSVSQQVFGVATNFAVASVMLTFSSFFMKYSSLKTNGFYVSQALYTIAILMAFIMPINEIWVRSLIVIGGIAMYSKLFKFTNIKWISYLISITTLLAYFTILDSMDLLVGDLGYFEYFQHVGGGVLLLALALYYRKKGKTLFDAFAVIGHIYMPIALLLTFIFYFEKSMWSFGIGLIIYAASTKIAVDEKKIKLFLYSAFMSIFMIFFTVLQSFEGLDSQYAFLLTSIVVGGFWIIGEAAYKKRTILFLVPISLLGISVFIEMYPYEGIPFVMTLLYSVGVLLLLHRSKLDLLTVIPLVFIYWGTLQYLFTHRFGAVNELLVLAVLGLALLFVGNRLYKNLIIDSPYLIKKSVDAYTVISFLVFATMYGFQQPYLWTKVLPGILIVLAVWMQRKRIPEVFGWVPTFIAGGYLLQPYYVLVAELEIPSLLDAEVKVLPLIALGIYLRSCLKGKYQSFTGRLQWAILAIVSLMLVLDGLESSTIYDALILGTLSLVSILVGVFLRIKSYFFIGSGVLLLNVFLQTRPYWGNLPWWGYLLIAGLILISVASYNEWQKQKIANGEVTLLLTIKRKIIAGLKKWD